MGNWEGGIRVNSWVSVVFDVEILSRGIALGILSHAHISRVHEHVCGVVICTRFRADFYQKRSEAQSTRVSRVAGTGVSAGLRVPPLHLSSATIALLIVRLAHQ